MLTLQTNELLGRLQVGRFDPADASYLEQVETSELIAELSTNYPIRFQDRRLKTKWEIGLAQSVQHYLVFRQRPHSLFMIAYSVPILRRCLMLSGEGDTVTGLSFTPRIRTRRVPRSAHGVLVTTSQGSKLDRFPDGWEFKALPRKQIELTEDFLRERGWIFEHLLPKSTRRDGAST